MKSLLIVTLLLLSGCASNPHMDLKRANAYGGEYCPTSGYTLVGLGTGTAAGIIAGSVATGGLVALISGTVMWSNTVHGGQIVNCK